MKGEISTIILLSVKICTKVDFPFSCTFINFFFHKIRDLSIILVFYLFSFKEDSFLESDTYSRALENKIYDNILPKTAFKHAIPGK